MAGTRNLHRIRKQHPTGKWGDDGGKVVMRTKQPRLGRKGECTKPQPFKQNLESVSAVRLDCLAAPRPLSRVAVSFEALTQTKFASDTGLSSRLGYSVDLARRSSASTSQGRGLRGQVGGSLEDSRCPTFFTQGLSWGGVGEVRGQRLDRDIMNMNHESIAG